MKHKLWQAIALMLILSFCLLSLCGCLVLDDGISDITPSEDEGNEKDSPSEETPPDSKPSEETITIQEQVLIDEAGIKLTAKSFEVSWMETQSIKLLLENDGTADIGLSLDSLIVNHYMITNFFSETVAAGKKVNTTLELSSADLEAAGISEVQEIELYFHTFDPDSFETLQHFESVTIRTSAYENGNITKQDDGKELYHQNGIRIVGKYVDNSTLFGTAVVLFMENNTDKNLVITVDDLSVNGFMITASMFSEIYKGKMMVDEITLLSSSLEENEIEKVESVELKFRVLDADTWDTVFETDVISFTTSN